MFFSYLVFLAVFSSTKISLYRVDAVLLTEIYVCLAVHLNLDKATSILSKAMLYVHVRGGGARIWHFVVCLSDNLFKDIQNEIIAKAAQ